MNPQQNQDQAPQPVVTQPTNTPLQQSPVAPVSQSPTPTSASKNNDKVIGIILAAIGFILVTVKSLPVQLVGIVLSVVGTYFIAKSKRANPAWAIAGVLPLIGPAIALFVKPASSEYGVSQETGLPNKKSPISKVIWVVAAFIILGSIFFFVIAPMMLKK